jgi:hypothetical protein
MNLEVCAEVKPGLRKRRRGNRFRGEPDEHVHGGGTLEQRKETMKQGAKDREEREEGARLTGSLRTGTRGVEAKKSCRDARV